MAARKIKYDHEGIPDRIATGIDGGTIPFKHDAFYGDPDLYEWSSSTIEAQYQMLKSAFARNGLNRVLLGGTEVMATKTTKSGELRFKKSFVLIAGYCDSQKMVWQKYESPAEASGTNLLYINGQKIKMSSFVAMTAGQQDELIEPCMLRRTLRLQELA
jgi:hypothetical protein